MALKSIFGAKNKLLRKNESKEWKKGLRGLYRIREAQIPYNIDFTAENNDLTIISQLTSG